MAEDRDVAQPFLAAHQRFLRDLQDAVSSADVQRSVSEAGRDYAKVLQSWEPPLEAQQRLQNTYEELAGAWRGQGVQAGTEPAVGEAYEGYVGALQQAYGQRQEQLQFAYRHYLSSLREAPRAMVRSVTQAFENYVVAIKEAWAQLDPQGFHPATLLAISQSIAAAASAPAAAASYLQQSLALTEPIPRDYLSEEAS